MCYIMLIQVRLHDLNFYFVCIAESRIKIIIDDRFRVFSSSSMDCIASTDVLTGYGTRLVGSNLSLTI